MRLSWWWLLDLIMRVVGNILQAKDRSQVLKVESFEECEPAHRHTAGYLQRRRGRKKGLVGSPPSKKPSSTGKKYGAKLRRLPHSTGL